MKILKITLIAIFTLIGASGMAQKKEKQNQRIAQADSILTAQLELTKKEQAEFLPVYHQYIKDKKANRLKFRPKKGKGSKKMEELSDEEIEAVIQKRFEFTQADLNLKKSYHEKFKKVLPIKKVAKFYHVEKRIYRKGKGKYDSEGEKRSKR